MAAQLALLVCYIGLPVVLPFEWLSSAAWVWSGSVLVALSAGVLGISAIQLGRSLTPLPKPCQDSRLVTSGLYGVVRHPIYFAVIVGAIGFSLISVSWPRLAWCGLLFLFFDMKSRVEERWLRERYPEYAAYQERVSRLLPWIY